jgi:hypothetical protein
MTRSGHFTWSIHEPESTAHQVDLYEIISAKEEIQVDLYKIISQEEK